MSKIALEFLDTKVFARDVQRWERAARNADRADLTQLRRQRCRARMLKGHLDKLIHTADARLALPMIGATGFPRPHNCDWAWRPELWRGRLPKPGMCPIQARSTLGTEVTLFHDCSASELTVRQLRNRREEDLAPYGLRLEILHFDGSFLSIVVDLPAEAIDGLSRNHLIQMDARIETEAPIDVFARLNVRHGPNTAQIVRDVPPSDQTHKVEFDLANTKLNEKRTEHAWVDLILKVPRMNQVTLRDLTFSRRPRAHF